MGKLFLDISPCSIFLPSYQPVSGAVRYRLEDKIPNLFQTANLGVPELPTFRGVFFEVIFFVHRVHHGRGLRIKYGWE